MITLTTKDMIRSLVMEEMEMEMEMEMAMEMVEMDAKVFVAITTTVVKETRTSKEFPVTRAEDATRATQGVTAREI